MRDLPRPVVSLACAVGLVLTAVAGGSLRATAQARDDQPAQEAFLAMADAERAFAKTAKAKGIRDAFIEWFADDAVGFQPTLGRAQDQLQAQPRPANPLAATLEWEPRVGDISRDGTFGWLTGPYTFTPPSGTPSHGCYFSVWIKTAAGWRVYMDIGAGTPGPVSFGPDLTRMRAPEGRFAARVADTPEARKASLVAGTALQVADDRANGSIPGHSTGGGLSIVSEMDPEARLHRPGMAPIVGRDAIRAHFSRQPWHVLFSRGGGTRLAPAQDFGVTYGTFRPRPGATVSAAPVEAEPPPPPAGMSGYYIRVWRRAADGRWLIVADLTQPSPPR